MSQTQPLNKVAHPRPDSVENQSNEKNYAIQVNLQNSGSAADNLTNTGTTSSNQSRAKEKRARKTEITLKKTANSVTQSADTNPPSTRVVISSGSRATVSYSPDLY